MTTWFITGASRGLGAEIARTAVGAGDNVLIAVRNPDLVPENLNTAANVHTVADSATIPSSAATAHDDVAA
ncbi:hypothetical protein [Nonomuraea sp. NPDC052265]|uniref:hypothetical protein n=1 Tax=Nonomuraea sp. NPDC052265 TaxID=3364374 RepID=UPI0037CA5FA1